jgi:hypothetical protein
MHSRRQFFRLSLIALLGAVAERVLPRTQPTSATRAQTPPLAQPASSEVVWTPLPGAPPETSAPLYLRAVQQTSPAPTTRTSAPVAATPAPAQAEPPNQVFIPIARNDIDPNDMPILGQASGTAEQAIAWFAAYAIGASEYTLGDITTIVTAYQSHGDPAEIDWFLALAQMAHETGNMTSWWSQRPRRNPAGIGVTGRTQSGTPDAPPGPSWTWDDRVTLWREGWSFPTWADHGVPAQLGRLLAYAMHDEQADAAQLALIELALGYRPLPADYRGAAPTICGLNGRWAFPGTTYGQSIVGLAQRMRDGPTR